MQFFVIALLIFIGSAIGLGSIKLIKSGSNQNECAYCGHHGAGGRPLGGKCPNCGFMTGNFDIKSLSDVVLFPEECPYPSTLIEEREVLFSQISGLPLRINNTLAGLVGKARELGANGVYGLKVLFDQKNAVTSGISCQFHSLPPKEYTREYTRFKLRILSDSLKCFSVASFVLGLVNLIVIEAVMSPGHDLAYAIINRGFQAASLGLMCLGLVMFLRRWPQLLFPGAAALCFLGVSNAVWQAGREFYSYIWLSLGALELLAAGQLFLLHARFTPIWKEALNLADDSVYDRSMMLELMVRGKWPLQSGEVMSGVSEANDPGPAPDNNRINGDETLDAFIPSLEADRMSWSDTIVFRCSRCDRVIKAKASLAGRQTKCKRCGLSLTVPFFRGRSSNPVNSVRFQCPECQSAIKTRASLAGKRGVCPKCGRSLTVPYIT